MLVKVFKASAYLTLTIFIVILCLEIYLRLFCAPRLVLHAYPRIYRFDALTGYKGIPNIDGYIRRPSVEKKFKLNNQGFYGPNFTTKHPVNVFRIIVCGASIVEGIWAQQRESFPSILNRKFKSYGYNVEVINCGVSGGSRGLQNIQLIREVVKKYQPNLIVFEDPIPIESINYYRDRYKNYSILFTGSTKAECNLSKIVAEKKVDLLLKRKLITDLADYFYFIRVYYRWAESNKYGTIANVWQTYAENSSASWQWQLSPEKEFSLKQSVDTLNRLSTFLEANHSKLFVYAYWTDSLSEKNLRRTKFKFRFSSLNIPLGEPKYRHKYDSHPNQKGYEIIANKLYLALVANEEVLKKYKYR